MFNRRNYFLFIAIIVMVLIFLPLINFNAPPVIGSFHFWALLWGVSLLIFVPQVFSQKLMLLVLLFGMYLFIMLNTFLTGMDYWNKKNIWSDFYAMIVAVSIISYFLYVKDFGGLALLTKVTLFFILITAVCTIFTTFISPEYSRSIASNEFISNLPEAEKEYFSELQQYGGGSRGDGFGFMAIIPLLIYYFKSETNIFLNKKLIISMIVIFLFALVRMQFAALLIYGLLFSILSFVSAKNRKILIITFITLVLLFILTPKRMFVDVAYNISDIFKEQNDLRARFQDAAEYLESGGGEITGNGVSIRLDNRYASSFSNFIKHPISGAYYLNTYNVSEDGNGHLFLMNKLTVTGIVGFIFWIYVFIYFYNKWGMNKNEAFMYFFTLSFISIISYGLVKSIIVRQAWALIFVIFPGMYYLPILKAKKLVKTL